MKMIKINIIPKFRRCCSFLLPSYYLLFLLFIIFMAIDVDHENTPPTIILSNNSTPPFPLLISLKSAGYNQLSNIFASGGFEHTTSQSNSTDFTIFAPPDHAFVPYLNSPSLSHLLLFHTSPIRIPYKDLLLMRSGVRIPSLLEHHPIGISARKFRSKECGGIILGGHARIIHPDLYRDSKIVVHGIDRVLDLDRLHNFQKRRVGKKVQKKTRKADGKGLGLGLGFSTCGRDLYLPLLRDSNPGPLQLPRSTMPDFDWLPSVHGGIDVE